MADHVPVLLEAVVAILQPRPGGCYLDATVGLGGHAEAVLRASEPTGTLVGIDRDAEALALAQQRLEIFGERVTLLHGRYEYLTDQVRGGRAFDGILFDLGASSLQLDTAARGFSFGREGPLDMRMDRTEGTTAEDIVTHLSEAELADLIFRFGEERWSRRIARAIVEARQQEPIRSTTALANVVRGAIPRRHWPRHIHPATRTFQALRIVVNDELGGLDRALGEAADLLHPGGRLVVMSFHSLEDRVVKRRWRSAAAAGSVRILTKRPIRPSQAEMTANPRARSARLRAVERLPVRPAPAAPPWGPEPVEEAS